MADMDPRSTTNWNGGGGTSDGGDPDVEETMSGVESGWDGQGQPGSSDSFDPPEGDERRVRRERPGSDLGEDGPRPVDGAWKMAPNDGAGQAPGPVDNAWKVTAQDVAETPGVVPHTSTVEADTATASDDMAAGPVEDAAKYTARPVDDTLKASARPVDDALKTAPRPVDDSLKATGGLEATGQSDGVADPLTEMPDPEQVERVMKRRATADDDAAAGADVRDQPAEVLDASTPKMQAARPAPDVFDSLTDTGSDVGVDDPPTAAMNVEIGMAAQVGPDGDSFEAVTTERGAAADSAPQPDLDLTDDIVLGLDKSSTNVTPVAGDAATPSEAPVFDDTSGAETVQVTEAIDSVDAPAPSVSPDTIDPVVITEPAPSVSPDTIDPVIAPEPAAEPEPIEAIEPPQPPVPPVETAPIPEPDLLDDDPLD